ncbi:glycine betaine ABC transporter substrate-binding protein [Kibdelosporangium persicum]|uniref:Substrate-binding region of ABC-type glycine betaine transport system n=1 Tax=Kibdelosporangium persicum TaxID=2698649 RepID=A0ABX2F9L3_9PSEU|nr:glycine betaine ABC transporter substrate-binding protein [Kibdelosporangium persicum]NRN68007.1 Substrate-binding region of ABC-type glycine betaine transport system [Kibdelosporangium persicum]
MRSVMILAISAAALLTGACGGSDTQATGQGSLNGATFTVGAKDFAEQNILAEMTAALLRANGAEAQAKEIKGSINTRKALEAGEVDLYWEYTGTAWITYLKNEKPLSDPKQQYDEVAKQDQERNGIAWLPNASFNNTYALAVRKEKGDELTVTSMSDLAALAKSRPNEVTICVESEFAAREDGLPGLLKAYGIEIPQSNIKTLDTGVIYTETDKGESCTFGEVFATDGRIKALDLTVLRDDKQFFPVYQGAPTLKKTTLDKHPQIKDILAPLSQKLTTEVVRDLNAKADVDGEDFKDIATEWLKKEGLLR